MKDKKCPPPVLVVGAGPVGLAAACFLSYHGIPLRILGENGGPTTKSKALVIHPRTMELLEDLGVVDDMLVSGHRVKRLYLRLAVKTATFVGDIFDAIRPKTAQFASSSISNSDSKFEKPNETDFSRSGHKHFPVTENIDHGEETGIGDTPSFDELQNYIKKLAPFKMNAHSPIWLSSFQIHARIIEKYQLKKVFFAGDSAHIHSPVGGQRLNLGIQDVANLVWKLALVWKRISFPRLLESYGEERRAIALRVLKGTDGGTKMAFSHTLIERVLRIIGAFFIQKCERIRRFFLMEISQLGTTYSKSLIVEEDVAIQFFVGCVQDPKKWILKGISPGSRAPDIPIKALLGSVERNGESVFSYVTEISRLHEILDSSRHHLLLFPGSKPASVECRNLHYIVSAVLQFYWPFIVPHWVLKEQEFEGNTFRQNLCVQPGETMSYATHLRKQLIKHSIKQSQKMEEMKEDGSLWYIVDSGGKLCEVFSGERFKLYVIRPDQHIAYRSSNADPDHLLSYIGSLLRTTFNGKFSKDICMKT